MEPVAGYLLVGVDVDGRPIAGHEALRDLPSAASMAYVEWRHAAPARVRSARFAGVPQGTYRLKLCADRECGTILETREDIEVRPSETTEVVFGS